MWEHWEPDTRVRFQENTLSCTQTLGNCPDTDRSTQRKALDATGGPRSSTASAQVGQPQAGTRYRRGSLCRRKQTVSHSPRPLRLLLPSARQLPSPSATAGAASRATSSVQPTASMLPSTWGGGRPRSSAAGAGRPADWSRDSSRRPLRAPHSARTASARPGVAQFCVGATSHLHVTHSSGQSWQQRNI